MAWDKPGHAVAPCTALPGKFSEEVECDLMFYKQEHRILHSIDRCIRYATGMEIPGKTMTLWTCKRYSDREGALNNDTAKAGLKAKGTELRMRARGQRATTIEARNGTLRHLLHVMEAELY
eukprot:4514670-Pyramimonas_sp.AAC.1